MTKKLCWITPDWFVDVDIPIVPHLSNEYDIIWIIVFPWRNNRFKEADFDLIIRTYSHISIKFIHYKYYGLDFRNLYYNWKIKKIIKRSDPDVIYFNIVPSGPIILPLYRWLPAEKTIVTAHDGCVKPSFHFRKLAEKCFDLAYNPKQYVQLFSPNEAEIFKKKREGKNIFVIPLAVKDFGKSHSTLRTDCISFISFGNINSDKNVLLLIRAAEKIYTEGYRNFKVVIKGRCIDWHENYQPLISHEELFEKDLRFIDNSEIPDIFASNWYAVFPYKQSGQSGVVKVALNYKKPVIVSDLPGFTYDIEDGYNGYVFKNNDVDSLANVLKKCIDNTDTDYKKLVANIERFVERKYSINKIVKSYREMFNKVLTSTIK